MTFYVSGTSWQDMHNPQRWRAYERLRDAQRDADVAGSDRGVAGRLVLVQRSDGPHVLALHYTSEARIRRQQVCAMCRRTPRYHVVTQDYKCMFAPGYYTKTIAQFIKETGDANLRRADGRSR
jgi:hypothetical protein